MSSLHPGAPESDLTRTWRTCQLCGAAESSATSGLVMEGPAFGLRNPNRDELAFWAGETSLEDERRLEPLGKHRWKGH